MRLNLSLVLTASIINRPTDIKQKIGCCQNVSFKYGSLGINSACAY